VAHNTALKARSLNRRRRTKEREAGFVPRSASGEEALQEVQAVLDEELSKLPERYRAVIVLCDLEGRTIKEAAIQLGWPQGTVATRLRQGRTLLANRLSRRGLPVAGALGTSVGISTELVRSTAQAALVTKGQMIPGGLISTTVAALTEGVLNAMFRPKLKTVVLSFAVAMLALTGGLLYCAGPLAGESPRAKPFVKEQSKPKGGDNLKNTILALDRHLWEASARGDWRERQKFLADDMVSLSVLGKYGKADSVEADKRYRCSDWTIRDAEVVRVSKDVAVLSYVYSCKILSSTGQLLGTRKDHHVMYVWANRRGGWVIVFCHDDHGGKSNPTVRAMDLYRRHLHESMKTHQDQIRKKKP
jgi:hypothetical protein